MRIATWNVNSVKQRIENLTAWLAERRPDIVCLQETKCVDEAFPREPIEALGYNLAVHGQKTFNGVAVLSKQRFDEVTPRLPGDDMDDHARFIEAVVSTARGPVRIASIYLPNGNPPDTDKYTYKLALAGAAEPVCRGPPGAGGAADPGRRLQRHPGRPRRPQSRRMDGRRAVPAADPGEIPIAVQSRPDRRDPRHQRRARPLHLLGLPGRRLAEEQRHPHRSSAAVAAGRRPAHRRRHRQARARLGEAVRPRSGLDRSGDRLARARKTGRRCSHQDMRKRKSATAQRLPVKKPSRMFHGSL